MGEKKAAKEIALKALSNVRSNGINCPFYGASLLALAHKLYKEDYTHVWYL